MTERPSRDLVVLKTPEFGDADTLPYRVDLLSAHGFRLVWDDRRARLTGRRARGVGRLEGLTTPFLQTWHLRRAVRRAPAVLAFFESEGHGLALARTLGFWRRPALVVVSCWLGEIAPRLGRVRRWLYRRLYRRVDVITVFSANQERIVCDALGLPAERVRTIPFGVDVDELARLHPSRGDYLLAVGRDAARDWETLYQGVAGTGRRVLVLARPRLLPERPPPPEIELLGYVERPRYLELLAGCAGVLVVTREAAYPTGQTVLLEALALGKPCVVSATSAMTSFGADLPCRWVQPGDPHELAAAVRDAPVAAAPAVPRARLDAAAMWDAVAEIFDEILDERLDPRGAARG